MAFDEAQFFSEGLLELTLGLLDRKKQVMIAGLNLDYLDGPSAASDSCCSMRTR